MSSYTEALKLKIVEIDAAIEGLQAQRMHYQKLLGSESKTAQKEVSSNQPPQPPATVVQTPGLPPNISNLLAGGEQQKNTPLSQLMQPQHQAPDLKTSTPIAGLPGFAQGHAPAQQQAPQQQPNFSLLQPQQPQQQAPQQQAPQQQGQQSFSMPQQGQPQNFAMPQQAPQQQNFAMPQQGQFQQPQQMQPQQMQPQLMQQQPQQGQQHNFNMPNQAPLNIGLPFGGQPMQGVPSAFKQN